MDPQDFLGATEAVVEQKWQGGDVVEVCVREQYVLEPELIGDRKLGREGTRIDSDSAVDQEAGGMVAWGGPPRAT